MPLSLLLCRRLSCSVAMALVEVWPCSVAVALSTADFALQTAVRFSCSVRVRPEWDHESAHELRSAAAMKALSRSASVNPLVSIQRMQFSIFATSIRFCRTKYSRANRIQTRPSRAEQPALPSKIANVLPTAVISALRSKHRCSQFWSMTRRASGGVADAAPYPSALEPKTLRYC